MSEKEINIELRPELRQYQSFRSELEPLVCRYIDEAEKK